MYVNFCFLRQRSIAGSSVRDYWMSSWDHATNRNGSQAKSAADWRFGTEAEYVSRLQNVTGASGGSFSLVGELATVILVNIQIQHNSPLMRILDSCEILVTCALL
jgi:hypothetical protein